MCLHHVTGVSPLTLTEANSTAGSPVNVALQLLQNNSHHAWTGWGDGSCNLATAAEPQVVQNCCPHTRVLHSLWPSSSRSPHNSVSNASDGSEDDILCEQREDSDTSDSEELSFINVDSSDEEFLGFPDD